ncbi:hypothetical protein [Sandarakinorhabdus oryzae]|uniref:hypothetical protein n=1 Tax=Sandarakinorhabdus oryzae TaxID=2675220 RepID=UPI0012E30B83|nr:hypothetical protein [Sandarakinorhabdus oryzae]
MMGYLFVTFLAAAVLAGLELSGRVPRLALELAACAMLIGMAGYAWQGSPALGGAPRGVSLTTR